MGAMAIPLTALPTKALLLLTTAIISKKAKQLPPKESLKFLLTLDNELYDLEGTHSVRYGNGVHSKHRHTSYHNFFIDHVKSNDSILDIGCGYGALAHDIAIHHPNCHITGIDLNERNIDKAIRKFPAKNITYLCGDILDERALPEQHFETIILSNVLEHLAGRADFLRKIQAKFSPNRILIRVPLFERDWRVPLKKELDVEWRLDATHETEYTIETWNDEIRRAQMRITHQEIRWGEIWAEVTTSNS